jgi:hypothetical protein
MLLMSICAIISWRTKSDDEDDDELLLDISSISIIGKYSLVTGLPPAEAAAAREQKTPNKL